MHTLVFKNVLFEAKPSTSKNHPSGFPLNLFICCATSPRGIKRIPLNTPIQAILGDFGASLQVSLAFFVRCKCTAEVWSVKKAPFFKKVIEMSESFLKY